MEIITNYPEEARAEIDNEFLDVTFTKNSFTVSTQELEKEYGAVPFVMYFGKQRFLFSCQTKDTTVYTWDSSYHAVEKKVVNLKKEVKYYYHLGERVALGDGHSLIQQSVWVPSNKVKQASPEFYRALVEREKQIIAETGLPGFHFPFECEELPPNKILINTKDESTDPTRTL